MVEFAEAPEGGDEAKLRLGIAAELEAVSLYEEMAEGAKDERVKKVMREVADEEKKHVGEFLEVLKRIAPKEWKLMAEGAKEVK